MPIYEYKCPSCNQRFEVMQRLADAPLSTCESCGGQLEKLVSAPAFQFKGSGWYVTDYARKGGEGKGDDAKGGEGKGDDAKGGEGKGGEGKGDGGKSDADGKSESRSESKGETKSEAKSESKKADSGGDSKSSS